MSPARRAGLSAILSSALLMLATPATAQVRVLGPEALLTSMKESAQKDPWSEVEIRGATGMFGAPTWNRRIYGLLAYRDSAGGSAENQSPHCKEGDYMLPEAHQLPKTEDSMFSTTHTVAVVLRGGCTFTQKALTAQSKGADAVIVVDNYNDASKKFTPERLANTIIADDGYGRAVTIPTLIITKEEGDQLIKFMKENPNQGVVVELNWDLPDQPFAKLDLWYVPGDRRAGELLADFSQFAAGLSGHYLHFEPHFTIVTGAHNYHSNCVEVTQDNTQVSYCAEDPDGPGGPITGSEVVIEAIRHRCVWSESREIEAGKPLPFSVDYWVFMQHFDASCPVFKTNGSPWKATDEYRFGTSTCSEGVISKNCSRGLLAKVQTCVKSETDKHRVNFSLDAPEHTWPEVVRQARRLAWNSFAVRINDQRIEGVLDGKQVSHAVCSALELVPEQCDSISDVGSGSSSGVSFGQLFMLLIVGCGAGALVLFVYKKCVFTKFMQRTLREEVMLEVQSQMTNYAPLDGDGGGAGGASGDRRWM